MNLNLGNLPKDLLAELTEGHFCTKCGEKLDSDKYKQCAECRATAAQRMRDWKAENPDYNAVYLKQWNRKRRQTVIEHYGGKCACCMEDRFEFLAIDHKNGGGEKHRKEVGQGSRMVDWIINNDFPSEFQILCHNCNQALGYYGYCPHQKGKVVQLRDE